MKKSIIQGKETMKKEQKRFNMYRTPNKPRWYLKLVEYIAGPVYMWLFGGHVKVEKEVKKLKKLRK